MPKIAVKKDANFHFTESNIGLTKDGGIVDGKGLTAQ